VLVPELAEFPVAGLNICVNEVKNEGILGAKPRVSACNDPCLSIRVVEADPARRVELGCCKSTEQ
jgi:hypothetical protein